MRAFQLKSQTGIEALSKVEIAEPTPARGQVAVRVAACSINYRDLAIATGRYRQPTRSSVIPLSDGAGEVIAVGADVTRVKVGDRVAGCFFQNWVGGEPGADTQGSALGGGVDGMLAEVVVLEQEGVVLIPAHMSFAEAATLPCARFWEPTALRGSAWTVGAQRTETPEAAEQSRSRIRGSVGSRVNWAPCISRGGHFFLRLGNFFVFFDLRFALEG